MTVTLAISLVCADFIPERKAALDRLLAALGEPVDHVEGGKKSVREWSEGLWYGGLVAAEARWASHCLFMTEDCIVPPDVLRHVRDALSAKPDEVVSFHPNSPAAIVARDSGLSWFTSVDGLVGTMYALPVGLLAKFLRWRETDLLPAAKDYAEDSQIGLWCMVTDRLIWHSVPGLFYSDSTLTSLFGHDSDPMKQPVVGFRDVDLDAVDWETGAVHAGRCYRGTFWRMVDHIRPEVVADSGLVKKAYRLARVNG